MWILVTCCKCKGSGYLDKIHFVIFVILQIVNPLLIGQIWVEDNIEATTPPQSPR